MGRSVVGWDGLGGGGFVRNMCALVGITCTHKYSLLLYIFKCKFSLYYIDSTCIFYYHISNALCLYMIYVFIDNIIGFVREVNIICSQRALVCPLPLTQILTQSLCSTCEFCQIYVVFNMWLLKNFFQI